MKLSTHKQEPVSHVIDRQPKASQQPEITTILQKYATDSLVIQCGGGGRGNHLYNDFLAHFQKHWIPRLGTILAKFKMSHLIDRIITIFEEAKHISEMREYTTKAERLFDEKDISGRSKDNVGENEKRYGSIMLYIDGLLKIIAQANVRDINIKDYDTLMQTLRLLMTHIPYFMVDATIGLRVEDAEILDIFQSLLNNVYQMLLLLQKTIHYHCNPELAHAPRLITEIDSEKTPLSTVLRESAAIPDRTIDHIPRDAIRTSSKKTPFPKFDEMLASRLTMAERLRALELESVQRPTNRITVPEHEGVFRFDPDEILGDRDNCFFETFRRLSEETPSIEELREIAGLSDGPAAERHIRAIAKHFGYTIHFLQFDMAFNPAPAVITVGSGERKIYIAQIFGGHFTPMYRVE